MTPVADEKALKPCVWCGPNLRPPRAYNSRVFAMPGDNWKVDCPGCGCVGPGTHDTEAEAIAAWNRRRPASAVAEAAGEKGWQPIETAPKGANGYAWMLLAWGPEEDISTGWGMRHGDKFYACGTFYCLEQERRHQFREIEVTPTYWRPLPAAPSAPPTFVLETVDRMREALPKSVAKRIAAQKGEPNPFDVPASPAEGRWTDDELRALWRDHGGSFHGPNVETGTMREADLLPFLRGLQASREPCPDCTPATGKGDGRVSEANELLEIANSLRANRMFIAATDIESVAERLRQPPPPAMQPASNEPEAAEVSDTEAIEWLERQRRYASIECNARINDICDRILLRLRSRPVAEVDKLYPRLHRFDGYDYIAVADYDAKVAELKRTRPVSMDKLELHSLDYAIRVLEMEGVYDVTVTRLTALRERLREGAK
jgi:hypothetical protein